MTNLAPARKKRVAITGYELFCKDIAEHVRRLDPSWEPVLIRTGRHRQLIRALYVLATSDMWYSIGHPLPDRLICWLAKALHKPRVIHWVGSDIDSMRRNPELLAQLSADIVRHLAEADFTARELRALGLASRVVPLPPRFSADAIPPLPKPFTVLLYIPRTRGEFYGKRDYERLLKALSGEPVRWLLVGGGSLEAPDDVHLENLGWREDLSEIYKDVTVLIRSTPRDGLSLMVLEALAFGRHVLWSRPFPHTRHIDSYEDMEGHVRTLLNLHQRGALRPQTQGAAYIREHYPADECINDIAAAWREALAHGAPAIKEAT